jgi:hypothetical protein
MVLLRTGAGRGAGAARAAMAEVRTIEMDSFMVARMRCTNLLYMELWMYPISLLFSQDS